MHVVKKDQVISSCIKFHQVDLWRWKPPIIKGVVSSFDIDEWMKLEMNETHLFTAYFASLLSQM